MVPPSYNGDVYYWDAAAHTVGGIVGIYLVYSCKSPETEIMAQRRPDVWNFGAELTRRWTSVCCFRAVLILAASLCGSKWQATNLGGPRSARRLRRAVPPGRRGNRESLRGTCERRLRPAGCKVPGDAAAASCFCCCCCWGGWPLLTTSLWIHPPPLLCVPDSVAINSPMPHLFLDIA